MSETFEENEFKFSHPFTAIIAGATMSGKTEFTKKLIENVNKMIHPFPQKIIFSYAEYQPSYDSLTNEKNVSFLNNLDFESDPEVRTLIIIDDQMDTTMKSNSIQNLFIKGVHHRNVSVILLNQNLFPQGKHGRDIRLNCHYYIVMKSPTLTSQVAYLNRQIFPNNPTFLMDAYKKATVEPYSHLFINLHPLCNDKLRVRSGILPSESEFIFIPK